jgi:hypothetical protein
MNAFQAIQDCAADRDHRITIEIEREERGSLPKRRQL